MAMDSRELGTLSLQVFGVHVDEDSIICNNLIPWSDTRLAYSRHHRRCQSPEA